MNVGRGTGTEPAVPLASHDATAGRIISATSNCRFWCAAFFDAGAVRRGERQALTTILLDLTKALCWSFSQSL
jgi:hypothetical protein